MLSILAGGAVLLFLAKATIILIGALLATLVMQRASAGSRHLVWLVTLGTLLLVPALTAWGPIRLAVLPPEQKAAAQRMVAPPELEATPVAGAVTPISPSPIDAQVQRTVDDRMQGAAGLGAFWRGAFATISLAVALWALVALAIVAVLLRDAFVLRRIVRWSTPLDTPEWRNMLYEIADRLELPDAPRLLRSDEAKMPFACGLRHATIVLPAESDGWSVARRRAVLLHELAHVRRHDLVGHMLGRLACAVYWFHPLVWTAAKQLRAESERACDDLALGCGTQASDYAEHLLDIVTSVRRASTPTVALAMARRKEFEGRMLAILDPDVKRAEPKRWQAGALVVSLAAMAVLVGAATPARRPVQQPVQQHVLLVPSLRPTIPTGESGPVYGARADRAEVLGDSAANTVANAAANSTAHSVGSAVANSVANSVASSVASSTVPTVTGALSVSSLSSIIDRATAGATGRMLAMLPGAERLRADAPPTERAALLIKVLQTDSSARVRATAAWGLAQIADVPGVAEAFAAALTHDTDASVRKNAAFGLAQSERVGVAGRDALMAAVQHDSDMSVRAQAAWALGNSASRSAVPALVAALHDTSEKVRSQALWAIGNIAPRPAPQGVIDALRDPSARVRSQAAWALFNIHDRAAAPALNAAFQHETDERVQVNILEALGQMGDAAMPSIRVALNSSRPRVKAAAVEALSMGGRDANPDPDPDPNPNP